MHRKPILFTLALLSAMGMSAQSVNEFEVMGPIQLTAPLMCDSVDPHGAKFEQKSYLNQKLNLKLLRKSAVHASADTASTVALEAPEKGTAMYVLESKLRAPRYADGNLEVTSAQPFQILIDGVAMATKGSSEDSITDASTQRQPLTLKPEEESILTIKILADAEAKSSPALKAAFVPKDTASMPILIYTDGKRPLRQYDMILGAKVNAVSMSPDGKYLILKYAERYDKDKTRRWATLTDLKTGKVINENLPVDYEWMPKGSRFYYAKENADAYDIYLVELPTYKEILLAENVPSKDFQWSPSEDYLLYFDYDAGEPNDGPLRRYKDPDDRISGNRARYSAVKYDLATGMAQLVAFGNRQASLEDLNADGSKALLMVYDYAIKEYPFYFNSLYEIDMNTFAVDTLVKRDPWITGACYSPDGKQLFVIGSPSAFADLGKNWGNHKYPSPEDVQGYIYDIATATAKPMTKDFDPAIQGKPEWNRGDGNIYFRILDGFDIGLCQLNPATGKITKLPQDIASIEAFTIGENQGDLIAYRGMSYDTAGRAYLYNLKNGKLSLLADPWAEHIKDVELGRTERYAFTAQDGTEIEGFLTYPPGFDSSKKYPMIVYYYGGCVPTGHFVTAVMGPQQFANRGYVVYTVNPSGCTGYGQEFSARHVNAWGDYTADDIIDGVKHVLADHDFINPDKVGAIGASYGGFMTQLLLTKTDIFAAAVSHAGISNVASYWGEGNWGYSYNVIAAAESYPWNNPDLYTKHGSLFNADKIHTPLLLLHGTADDNVPPGESIQLFNALKILGQDVELITVDGENHGVADWEKRLQWQNAYLAWFAKYLQDDPAWWDAIK